MSTLRDPGPGRDELIRQALERRGDVTFVLADGRRVVGYLFAVDAETASLRLFPADGGDALGLPLDAVCDVELTGREATEAAAFRRSRELAARRRD